MNFERGLEPIRAMEIGGILISEKLSSLPSGEFKSLIDSLIGKKITFFTPIMGWKRSLILISWSFESKTAAICSIWICGEDSNDQWIADPDKRIYIEENPLNIKL